MFRPLPNGGATAYFRVLLLDFGCSSVSDVGSDVILKPSERYEICVRLNVSVEELLSGVFVHTNSLLKKSPTSSVVDGPPMFMKTIAVPFLELTGIWAADGATLALPLLHGEAYDGRRTDEAGDVAVARVHTRVMLERNAIVRVPEKEQLDRKAIDNVQR